MLDRSGGNNRIVFRWLGGMVGEPVWEGDSVSFYARDDEGGRLEEVVCQPASDQDLRTILKDDVEKLRERLGQSRAETPTERLLRRTLLSEFEDLVDKPYRTDLDSYFFRYRDILGNWRLVWCWGYQRLDAEPAPAVVCTDPACNLLFVRRPGKSPRCPSCEGLLSNRPMRRTNWRIAALAGLLLLLLFGGALWWAIRPSHLIAAPSPVVAPVGSRVEFQVWKAGLLRKQDVTRQSIGISYDPRVARLNQAAGTVTLVGTGTTKICFYAGRLKTEVPIQAEPSANPDKIFIEPSRIELAVGSTARAKLVGEYKDGKRADLSEVAQWKVPSDGTVYASGSLVEGMAQGTSTLSARYRANPESPWMDASTAVTVTKVDFLALEAGVDPKAIGVGLAGKLRMDAVATDGHRYSVLESSQLKASVDPSYVAAVAGANLQGRRTGAGKLAAVFGEKNLSAGADFTVVAPPAVVAEVRPENLDLVVGEIADISYVSPEQDPLRLSSSRPGIVDITAANRIIGRAVGDTEIDVSQSGKTIGKIGVTVTQAEFQSLAIDPAGVAMAVDDTARPRVMALIKGSDPPRSAEIAPDLVVCERVPSPRYAELDQRLMELRGVAPTNPLKPETLLVKFAGQKASAAVEVMVAPCRLEIAPPGPIDLPLGQMMRLSAYATYSGGRCVQVPSERLRWASEEKSVPGLKIYNDRIGAVKAGAGPLTVYASYFRRESNRVVFKSVEADPNLKLALELDRMIRLTGEQGQAMLTGSSPAGDVELVPELAAYKSSDVKVLKMKYPNSGQFFTTRQPGEATITASHAAAKDPVSLKLRVYDAAKSRLVFDPAAVKVAVNEQVPVNLMLEVTEGGKPERVAMEGPGVGYTVERPDAVRWAPPRLTGLSPSKPFELSGRYPVLSRPAYARVEVVAAEAEDLRITPAAATLAPGQTITLAVERKEAGSDQWQEVRPDAAAWSVPARLLWTPATQYLRPALTVPPDVQGDLTLQAAVEGKEATATIKIKPTGPDAKDAAARLVFEREPGGWYVPVGQQQRYAILVDKGGAAEPAADIHWPANFENDYIRWEAPVLTAKRENYTQWMRAEAGGRAVLFHTTTCMPPPPDVVLPPSGDVPQFVKILSDQGPVVRFPVGAAFNDFRVEAHYADGFTRLVTKRCTIRTPEPPESAYLTASNGRLIGVRVGATDVSAEYDGVHSQAPPLKAEVLAGVDIDRLAIDPSAVIMRPGETSGLKAIGYKNGKSVGDLTGLSGMEWQSTNAHVARVNGPSVVGAALGQAAVTVRHAGTTSPPAPVTVTDSITDALKVEPKTITLHVNESLQIGSDISVSRGDMDVSRQCEVTPELAGVVDYNRLTGTLTGRRVGHVPVAFALGDKVRRVLVDVVGGVAAVEGEVAIEPASPRLAPGQSEHLRVFIIAPDGERIDRTTTAVFKTSDDKVAAMQGDRLCALSPGKANILAVVGGMKPGRAAAEVVGEPITKLDLDPKQIDLSVGDTARMSVFGESASCGTKELFPQPELKIAPVRQGVIQVVGNDEVHALAVGQDAIQVSFRDLPQQQIQVTVANNPFTDLQIEPAHMTLAPGQSYPYQVSAMRGGQRHVLTPEQGVQMFVGDPNVAQVVSGTAVAAKAPGHTTLVARLGGQKAEANLDVVGGGVDTLVGTGGTVGGGTTVVDPYVVAPGTEIVGTVGGPGRVVIVHGDGGVGVVGTGVGVIGTGTGVGVIGTGTGVIGTDVGVIGDTALVPAGRVVGLQFEPQAYHSSVQAQPQGVRIFERLENGQNGREVSADPNLTLTEPSAAVATVEKAAGKAPVIHPVAPGVTRMTATLGTLTTAEPLLIDIQGDVAGLAGVMAGAQLVVNPPSLPINSGETAVLGGVQLDPGGGQVTFGVKYKITAPEGQGIVTVDGNKIHGVSPGTVQVTVTAVDPKYQGLSASVSVQVGQAAALTIQPPELSLQVGDSRPIAVMAKSTDGTDVAVPALVDSVDPSVGAMDPNSPGTFVAKAMGQTKIVAKYGGAEAFATVSVTGQRFETVNPTLDPGGTDFAVNVEVLAAPTAGALEYRVYKAGDNPEENWVPNQLEGNHQKVVLRSQRMPYAADTEMYHLVLEARDKGGQSVQKYPLTFQLIRTIQIQQLKEPLQPKDTK
jgi:hypothetical protein